MAEEIESISDDILKQRAEQNELVRSTKALRSIPTVIPSAEEQQDVDRIQHEIEDLRGGIAELDRHIKSQKEEKQKLLDLVCFASHCQSKSED
jgi:peptidoglycan hydrolase CwlO-like protein